MSEGKQEVELTEEERTICDGLANRLHVELIPTVATSKIASPREAIYDAVFDKESRRKLVEAGDIPNRERFDLAHGGIERDFKEVQQSMVANAQNEAIRRAQVARWKEEIRTGIYYLKRQGASVQDP